MCRRHPAHNENHQRRLSMLNYELRDATRELTIVRSLDNYTPPFKLIGGYKLIDNGIEPEATVQIEANGRLIHEASTGNAPSAPRACEEGAYAAVPRYRKNKAHRLSRQYPRGEARHRHRRRGDHHLHRWKECVEGEFIVGKHQRRVVPRTPRRFRVLHTAKPGGRLTAARPFRTPLSARGSCRQAQAP